MSLLIERAENFNAESLVQIVPINSYYITFLEDYLFSDRRTPFFLLGTKGSGKTFIVMKALANAILKNTELLPAMFVYKQSGRAEMLDPLRLAPRTVWGDERYYNCSQLLRRRKEDVLNEANVVVEDDLHYRCERIVEGRESPDVLVNDIKRALETVDSGKKVILVSEEPLAAYASKLKLTALEEFLPRFGELPWVHDESSLKKHLKLREECDCMASREILPPRYEEWRELFKIYGVNADEFVSHFLYLSNSRPRAFIRFFQLFQPGKKITMDDVVEKARKMSPESVAKKNQKFYEFLLRLPVIDMDVSISDIERLSAIPRETVDQIYQYLPLIKEICSQAAKLLKPPMTTYDEKRWVIDPAYALRRKESEDWYAANHVLAKALSMMEEKIPPEIIGEIGGLVSNYYSRPAMIYFEQLRELYTSIPREYFARLLGNFSHYYTDTHVGYILTKPLQDIFGNVLHETPSLDLIEQLAKISLD